jgi:hypothetical protein
MIIDSHAHAALEQVLPVRFFDGWVDNLERLLPPDASPAQRSALMHYSAASTRIPAATSWSPRWIAPASTKQSC